jgi:hypothetical protein
MSSLTLLTHLTAYALTLAAAQILMKLGLQSIAGQTQVTKILVSAIINPLFSLGFFLQVLCVVYWLYLLKFNRLSIMFPIATSVAFVAITIGSSLFLKDVISLRMIVGTAIIAAGIFVVASA